MHVRCPHCNSSIELSDASSLSEILCASCGSSFSLIADTTIPYPETGRKLGHFELIDVVGMGSFGTVWKARDTELERVVAIKIPRKNQLDASEAAKFFREARAAAQPKHPHIVPVHEVGREGDTFYIATDYIEGASLKEWLSARRLTPHEAAQLCIKIAEALHHAHQAGVVHRDLKPGNVMIDLAGEPHLMDFGLAKRDSGEVTMTIEGQILGTPAYMSPEQARGQGHDADRRVDIYSLGVILFELLTGELPFRGEKRMLMVQIANDEPISPRKLRSNIPRDLETICLKCLQKDAADRYATAQQLADDLRRFLQDEPIRARPVGKAERLWRWCRRSRRLLATAATVLVTIGVAIVFAYQARLAERGRQSQADQLLAERRQNALDKALLLAMGGDFQAAETAIADAELLGASTGHVRMLRGQVAYHRGETPQAIEHLEQAVQLLPDSVAAGAMLAMAYYHSGRTARMDEIFRALETMPPKTAEDYLFKGQLDAMLYPEGTQETRNLDDAVRHRDSVIARVVRAEARANRALFSGRLEDAEGALEDAQAARSMLPDNPFVLAQGVYAEMAASIIYERLGQIAKHHATLARAAQDVEKLKTSSSPVAFKTRFWYYDLIGDEEAAFEISGQGPEFRRVGMLYRRGQFTEALAAADRAIERKYGLARIERGFVLAELPGGPAQALAAFQDIAATDAPDDSRFARLCTPMLPLLLGKTAESRRVSLELRKDQGQVPPGHDRWYFKILDYNCGLMATEDLLDAAGPNRLKQCEAHFVIGLHRLAEGDRAGARQHFRQCADTKIFIYWDWVWARAFLARMEKDPSWPSSIPTKSPNPG